MLTFGFYNSVDGDRVYDARDMGAVMEGLLTDGVYKGWGDEFEVVATYDGMPMIHSVGVKSGRGWWNHTWNYNPGLTPLTLTAGEPSDERIDLVVIEVDTLNRINTLKILTGEPNGGPEPTLQNDDVFRQIPIARLHIPAQATEIDDTMIENLVGTAECPYAELLPPRKIKYPYQLVVWASEMRGVTSAAVVDDAGFAFDFPPDEDKAATGYFFIDQHWPEGNPKLYLGFFDGDGGGYSKWKLELWSMNLGKDPFDPADLVFTDVILSDGGYFHWYFGDVPQTYPSYRFRITRMGTDADDTNPLNVRLVWLTAYLPE